MKKICCFCLKYVLLVAVIVSSAAAIYINHTGNKFDPIREIQKLKTDNRRDDALDLIRFYQENQTGDSEKLARLEKELEYTKSEKLKSFIWHGAKLVDSEENNTVKINRNDININTPFQRQILLW